MKVRLDRVGDEPSEWRETLALHGDDIDDSGLVALSEVAARGEISALSSGYLMRAVLAYEQTLSCTRCLADVVRPVERAFDLTIEVASSRPGARGEPKEETQLDEADLGLLVLDEPVLDTRPIVVEQVRLEIPMKPLCREDCAGLCGTCGADLNEGACGCEEATDPRWSALAKLKERTG